MESYDHFAFLNHMGGRLRRVAWDGSVDVTRAAPPSVSPLAEKIAEQGREAWRLLHSEPHGTPEWFADWAANHIPRGCGCGASSRSLVDVCPPRYETAEDWFAWTVDFHNLVNRKLNKPELSLADALAIWRP